MLCPLQGMTAWFIQGTAKSNCKASIQQLIGDLQDVYKRQRQELYNDLEFITQQYGIHL